MCLFASSNSCTWIIVQNKVQGFQKDETRALARCSTSVACLFDCSLIYVWIRAWRFNGYQITESFQEDITQKIKSQTSHNLFPFLSFHISVFFHSQLESELCTNFVAKAQKKKKETKKYWTKKNGREILLTGERRWQKTVGENVLCLIWKGRERGKNMTKTWEWF